MSATRTRFGPEAALLAARAFDEIDANIAVLDRNGSILLTNRGWQQFAESNRLADGSVPRNCGIGANYLDACRSAEGPSAENSALIGDGLRSVLDGRKKAFSHEYPCHSPTRKRWFVMKARPIRYSRPRMVVVIHWDITEKRLAEMAVMAKQRELGTALNRLQAMAGSIRDSIAAERWAPDATALVDLLSRRELEVMRGLVRGERNSALADRLHLSRKSVSTYRSRVLEKLKVETNAELVALAYTYGLVKSRGRDGTKKR